MTPTAPPCARPLTPRQREVLGFIVDYVTEETCAPTLQEIADVLGGSKVSIFEHVTELARKGYITRDPHKARSIRIVGGVCPTCGHRNGQEQS